MYLCRPQLHDPVISSAIALNGMEVFRKKVGKGDACESDLGRAPNPEIAPRYKNVFTQIHFQISS